MNEKDFIDQSNITELDFKIGSIIYMTQKINLNTNSETSEKIDLMLKIYKKFLISKNNSYKEYIENYLLPTINLSQTSSPKFSSPKSFFSTKNRYHTRKSPKKSPLSPKMYSSKSSRYSALKRSKKYSSLYDFPRNNFIMSGAGGELQRPEKKSSKKNSKERDSKELSPPKGIRLTEFINEDTSVEDLENIFDNLFDKDISNIRNESKEYIKDIASKGKEEINEMEDKKKSLERLQMDILKEQREVEEEKRKLKEERHNFEQEKLYKELNDMKNTVNELTEHINTLKDTNLAILDETKKNSKTLDQVYNITGNISKEVHDIYTKGKLTWKSPISFAMIMAFKLSVLTVKNLVWPALKFGTFGWWAGPAIYAFKRSTKYIKYIFGMYILIMIGTVVFKVYHNLNPTELGTNPSMYQYVHLITKDLINGQIIIPLTNYYNSHESLYQLLESSPTDILSFITPGGINNPGTRIISQGTNIISGGEMKDIMLDSTKSLYEGYAPEMFKSQISMIGEAISYITNSFTNLSNMLSRLNPRSWW